MKVRVTRNGFDGQRRYEGEVYDVPVDTESKVPVAKQLGDWREPVDTPVETNDEE